MAVSYTQQRMFQRARENISNVMVLYLDLLKILKWSLHKISVGDFSLQTFVTNTRQSHSNIITYGFNVSIWQ